MDFSYLGIHRTNYGFIGEEKTQVSLIDILLLGFLGYSLNAFITNVYLSLKQWLVDIIKAVNHKLKNILCAMEFDFKLAQRWR